MREEEYERERKAEITAGIYPDLSRMRHWNWKCMEVSLYGGTGRRRSLCFILYFVFGDSGIADYEYGVCSGTSQPEKSGEGLSGIGKAGTEVAYSWICDPDRLLSSDDVLYNGGRLDAALFLSYGDRKVRGNGLLSLEL